MVRALKTLIPTSKVPDDEAFSLHAKYLKDSNPLKVNLGIGVYRTEQELPWPLPVVEEAEKALYGGRDITRHEYLKIQGDLQFLELARDLAFDIPAETACQDDHRDRIVSVQTISGTGANHIGAKYLSDVLCPRQVWLPSPGWGNHTTIWNEVGVKIQTYPYYSNEMHGIDFQKMMQILENDVLPGDVILFHAVAHNPTGSDLSHEQWMLLIDLCLRRGLVPLLDLAYQGFASGSVSEDAWAIKAFLSRPELEFCVAQSFSKNFGLYGQRVGALHVVVSASSTESRGSVLAHLVHLVRTEYSMAPRAGSDIVRTALQNPILRDQWKRDLLCMSARIKSTRKALHSELVRLDTPGSWQHILQQVGMFSYTGLTESQVQALQQRYHIYMLQSGRMSMSGVTTNNVSYIAKAFDNVVRTL